MIVNNFWEGKKVLVTGHTGFKGGWLSIWLKILGAKVSGYSLNPSGNNNLFTSTKISKIFNYDFRGDINNITRLRNCIKISKPQIIFHLAAQPSVAESFKEPLNTTITNVVGTVNLLEIIRKNKFIKSAVIITTDKVYKVPKLYNSKLKFKENASLGGEDLYSASKASAELIVHSYLKSFFAKLNCNIATARAGNCIGGGDWKKDRIIKDCMESFFKNKKLIIRKPKSTRPWQHVLEPLFGYLVLAEKLFSKKGKNFVGSWNFGPNFKDNLTVKELALFIKKKLLSSSKVVIRKNNKIIESDDLNIDSSKSIKKLNWKPIFSLDECINFTISWYLAHKKKRDMFQFTKEQILKYQKKIKI